MTTPTPSALTGTAGHKHWHLRHLPTRRRRRERAAVRAHNLNLDSAGTSVPLAMVENDPLLRHLVVADLCWRLETEDLDRHRPRRGDRAGRDAWLAQQELLETQRKRLAAMVTESIGAL